MKVIFLFIDGIGLGDKNMETNPLYAASTGVLARLMEEADYTTDATLGVVGLPQSATGQTAIFTGFNAPAVLNRHLSGQPTITLKKLIYKNNIFKELKNMGMTVTSANVYRNEYLENMLNTKDRRSRPSVTSVMGMSEKLTFRTDSDFKKHNGVYHDLTGERLKESGYDVDLITPEKAAKNLYKVSRNYDFTLFEHFITDLAGHKFSMQESVRVVENLDRFIAELIELMNFDEDVLIITSDHGNLEDLTVRTHTMNKVPFIVKGKKSNKVKQRVDSLVDIMPFVLELFRRDKEINE